MASRWRLPVAVLAVLLWCGATAQGEPAQKTANKGPIQDNSFLLEEAYNQELGVIQHISTFTRWWNSKDWNYSFTQEWPAPRDPRHQFSYTLVGTHIGEYGG